MPDIPGNSSTGASIGVGGSVINSLETIGDHDWFAITLTAGQSITITMSGFGTNPLEDPYLWLRDSSGNLITFNDDGAGNGNAQINFTATTSGVYYIDAGAWNNQSDGTYQISVNAYTPPPIFDYDQIADQLVNGYWESVGGSWRHFNVDQGGTITVNLTGLTAAGQYLARHALELWSDSLGINFVETDGSAQITFDDDDGDRTSDSAYSSSVTSGHIIISSEVNIDVGWINAYGTGLDTYSFQTYLHEIGHALGLGHAGNYNGSADYNEDALYQNDAWSTTVMSYFSQQESSYFANQGFTYDYVVTPMVGDLVAMAFLYGTPTTTRTGNTTYGFNSTAGREVFDATLLPGVAYTVIDSGGIDTLDYSGFAADQLINLNAETFSNVGGAIGNVSIARGTVIENAIGGSGNDVLIGNGADNILVGNGGNDSLDGGGGSDTASYAAAAAGVTVNLGLVGAQNTGGAGSDTLTSIENLVGSRFNDVLTGNNAANRLEGGPGNDTLDGAGGIDTADYSKATSAVVIDLRLSTAQNTRGAGYDTLISIEQLIGSDYNDRLYGNSAANWLDGGAGSDYLYGFAGNDTLIGGAGNDRFYGGAGDDVMTGGSGTDTIFYSDATAGITVDLSRTTAQDTGGAGTDTLSGIEYLNGSRYADTVTGDAQKNVISGWLGDDVIHGGGGDDRLDGQQDNDTLYGDAGNDQLIGRTGDDKLYGGDGDDRLYGDDGNDLIDGGAGSDTANYLNATAGITLNLGIAGPQDTIGAGIDTLVSIERVMATNFDDTVTGSANADRLYGAAGNDVLNGAAGADFLLGQAGNDTLNGGAGNDRLYGGAGQDMFRFDTALSSTGNWDYIADFSAADDTIQLDASIFSAIGSAGVLDAAAFHIGTKAADADDRIIYDQAHGKIYYDADGSGSGAMVMFARVANNLVLTNADFQVLSTAQSSLETTTVQTALFDAPKDASTFESVDSHAMAPPPAPGFVPAVAMAIDYFHAPIPEHYIF